MKIIEIRLTSIVASGAPYVTFSFLVFLQGRAISWMSELVMEHNIPVFSCFSITLGAVLFKGVTKPHSACRTSETVNYMKVCFGQMWSFSGCVICWKVPTVNSTTNDLEHHLVHLGSSPF